MRIRLNIRGQAKCPYCKKYYVPVLEMPDPEDNRTIQKIYPDTERWEREQLVTGICCDRCWDKYLGVGGNTYTQDGRKLER